jgi:4-oxalocrotonate tautomerase
MPVINVRTIKGLLNDEKRKLIQKRITDLFVEIEGGGNPGYKPYIWVSIEELEPEQWAMGGQPLSQDTLKRIRE